MTLLEEYEQAKRLEAEAFEAAKAVEEPFKRKIEDLKRKQNEASKDAWNKHHVARTKTWEVNEKIFQARYEKSKEQKAV